MSKRNLMWLIAVLAVGALGWLAFGIVAGLLAAGVMLFVSEVIERRARRKRRSVRPGP